MASKASSVIAASTPLIAKVFNDLDLIDDLRDTFEMKNGFLSNLLVVEAR